MGARTATLKPTGRTFRASSSLRWAIVSPYHVFYPGPKRVRCRSSQVTFEDAQIGISWFNLVFDTKLNIAKATMEPVRLAILEVRAA